MASRTAAYIEKMTIGGPRSGVRFKCVRNVCKEFGCKFLLDLTLESWMEFWIEIWIDS